MNLLDEFIAIISPSTALNRVRSRYAMDVLSQRKYTGASMGRRGREWQGIHSSSANTELEGAAETLRNRMRDLCRNDPYARRAINVIANNTVGTGINIGIRAKASTLKTASKKKTPTAVVTLQELWRTWADSTGCDSEGLKTLWSMQHMVMKAAAESGECFVLFVRDPKAPGVPLRLQILEADYLDTSRGLPSDNEDGGYILQGIQFNKNGTRKGYWFWDAHPGETRQMRGISSHFVAADRVAHIFLQERPGQVRGVPFGAPVMQRLHDFAEYEDTQLIRQKIAACFAIFIEDPVEATPGKANPTGGPAMERVEPGIIERMGPGQKVTFGSPPPTENYSEYSSSLLHGVAAGWGMSYEALTGDLSKTNYSSGRMGWIEFQRQIEAWQWNMLIPMFCMKVWEKFLEAARVKLGDESLDADCTWTPPRRQMIDPTKEVQGMAALMNAGLSSWESLALELGEDPEILFPKLVAEKKRFEAADMASPMDMRLNSPPAPEEDATQPAAPTSKKPASKPKKP